eukprot:TRINITY_DN797_c0_g1_i1.p1 TRINITY_DN797_c0_g1~~TRINITY_DN797_c0_g1_i1.p1  ORF type:complete len:228 (-),score=69.89 TRINITY_DN797_c0_g1_i1:79-762(-)
MKFFIVFFVFLNLTNYLIGQINEENCYSVLKGNHYATPHEPFKGFRSTSLMSVNVLFKNDSANYLFGPDEEEGQRCQTSWNKLFGASRCGHLHHHHLDSDRFAWRRHPDCMIYENGRVIGEIENCPYANKIQICAYAYDAANKPYQNDSLLTIFETLIDVENANYTMIITWQSTNTLYSLIYDNNLIEQHTIQHRNCDRYDEGYYLGFYFGGACPAPQTVSACFNQN